MRSNIYLPGEALEIDSLYLPRDRYGNSKALIMVDVASSKTSVFPGTSLQAATVRAHIIHFLCASVIPRVIICDMGSEFMKNLDIFLAQYNISLQASQPYHKGSTAAAESTINLVKSALRRICEADPSEWCPLSAMV